jgi:Putative peptidoglycan binding domain
VASSSGTWVLVVLGLVALGAAGDGCDSESGTSTDSGAFGSAPADDDALFDDDTVEDDDFSFEPEGGNTASSDDDTGGGTDCDDVVIVESGSAEVDVPGESHIFSESSVDCEMSEGDDGAAVAALQDALERCNGQNVDVDAEYGPQTSQAVAAVQAQNGLDADGTYGPDTMRVMSWPAGDTCTSVG